MHYRVRSLEQGNDGIRQNPSESSQRLLVAPTDKPQHLS